MDTRRYKSKRYLPTKRYLAYSAGCGAACGLGAFNVIARGGVFGYGLPLMAISSLKAKQYYDEYKHNHDVNKLHKNLYNELSKKYPNVSHDRVDEAAAHKTALTIRLHELHTRRDKLIRKRDSS